MTARVGILAIQGDVEAHARALESLGAVPRPVLHARDLDDLGALILPGGESTTIAKGLDRLSLYGPIQDFAARGRPILGTCAGAILLASSCVNHPVRTLGLIDMVAERNAYGTQADSFAAHADRDPARPGPDPDPYPGPDDLRCVFIRAPQFSKLGPGVEVLARVDGAPVWLRQGAVMVCSFHPELTKQSLVHRQLLKSAGK
jgi:5'-phosphate synthase pdxT subunit